MGYFLSYPTFCLVAHRLTSVFFCHLFLSSVNSVFRISSFGTTCNEDIIKSDPLNGLKHSAPFLTYILHCQIVKCCSKTALAFSSTTLLQIIWVDYVDSVTSGVATYLVVACRTIHPCANTRLDWGLPTQDFCRTTLHWMQRALYTSSNT